MPSYAQIAENNAKIDARNKARPRGPKTPQKYPVAVGPNYNEYGEQPGYIYNPYTDKYVPDPKAVNQIMGVEEQKPPSLAQQIGLPAAILGTAGLATEGAKMIPGMLKGGLSLGGETALTESPEAINAAYEAAMQSGGYLGGEAGTGAATTPGIGNGLMSIGAPLAVAGIGAYTAKKGYDGWNAGQGKGFMGGLKAGWKESGPLKFVPVLGQAPLIAGALGGVFGHKSTRDIQGEHTSGLLGIGKDDQNWQGYVEGMRAQHNDAPPDPSKPFAGKYANWDEYVKGGLEASNLTGVYGNLDTFGPDWAKYSQAQREAVTQGIIDKGLYSSKSGEVVITDPGAALAVRDQIIGGAPVVAAPQISVGGQPLVAGGGLLSVGAQPPVQIVNPPRSTTLSPGINLKGQRIVY